MEMLRLNTLIVMGVMELVLALVIPSINAQGQAPAAAPSSDVVALDQGIAYLLMLFALLLTYIIH